MTLYLLRSICFQPENILVDGNGEVKLVDLGEGVRRNSVKTGSVLPPVSLEFAAPEMVLGKAASSPADMWSAGVFLYVFLRFVLYYRYMFMIDSSS